MPPAPANEGVSGGGQNVADEKGTSTLISIWIVTSIAIIFTTGRLYVRGYMQRRLRSDDHLTIFSVFNSIVACGLATKAVSRGLGRHVEALSPEDQSAAMVWTFAAFFPGLVSFACPKLAVIALLVRLLLPSRFHFCFLWFMGAAVQLAQIGTMGLLISDLAEKCHLSDSAQIQKQRGNCVPMHVQVRYYLFAGSLSAFADFYLAVYPSIVLYHLQMPGRKKFALSVALGFGLVPMPSLIAVYLKVGGSCHVQNFPYPSPNRPRFYMYVYLDGLTSLPLPLPHANAELQLWTLVEGGIIVIASSIPILQPLIDKIFGTRIMGRPHAYFTKYMAMFSDRRKIATEVRQRIRDQHAVTTTTDFTMTTLPEELAPVHRHDSGIDGTGYDYPRHGADGGYRNRGDLQPGVINENPAPKE
ncbi:hypothetical protein PG985_004647 [Apiospora marii]|uniref:Rhodopsin domain-containing protein n=1 Tax=Apiospora marii TaxID=335849 RepID=A0ABR1SB76_9PEZI